MGSTPAQIGDGGDRQGRRLRPRASDYTLPKLDSFDRKSPNTTAALADAEIKLDVAVLRYARDARGGRFDWTKDQTPIHPTLALPDPLQVIESMAIRSDPAVYLRSFQPDQPQFQALRKALIAARGGSVEEKKDDVVRILRAGASRSGSSMSRWPCCGSG